jgi:hypothetical protein
MLNLRGEYTFLYIMALHVTKKQEFQYVNTASVGILADGCKSM